jgi:hypothetical protein
VDALHAVDHVVGEEPVVPLAPTFRAQDAQPIVETQRLIDAPVRRATSPRVMPFFIVSLRAATHLLDILEE